MANKTNDRQTCWVVKSEGPHGAVSYSRIERCRTLREARLTASRLRGATIHRGYGHGEDASYSTATVD